MDQHASSIAETTREIIRHLWKRRLLLLITPVIAFVGAYLYVYIKVGEVYESAAQLYVRERTSGLRNRWEQGFTKIEPPAYEDILRGDELLKDLVNEARAKFPAEFPQDKYEKVKKRFAVDVVATHDTTVTTTYSPIITLKAEGETAAIAHFLATRWMEMGIERFGMIVHDEAKAYMDAIWNQARTMGEQIATLTGKESALKQEVFALETRLAALNRILSSDTPVSLRERQTRDDLVESSSARVKADTSIRLYGGGQSDKLYENYPLGLLEEKVRLELEIAQFPLEESEVAGKIKGRLARLIKAIEEVTTESATVRGTLSGLEGELAGVQAELNMAHSALEGVERTINYAASDMAVVFDPKNPENKGDLRIISRPSMPEVRIKPSRTLIAAAVSIAISIFLLFMLIAEFQLKQAIKED